MGLRIVKLWELSTSIGVGSVICGGVSSGECIATLFLRGFGEEAATRLAGSLLLGCISLLGSSCVSIGVGPVHTSCWLGVGSGLGMLGGLCVVNLLFLCERKVWGVGGVVAWCLVLAVFSGCAWEGVELFIFLGWLGCLPLIIFVTLL